MKRIAIIGGGISGLSAAFHLERLGQAGVDVEYSLYESGPRFGGVLLTEQIDGCVVEAGPDSFLSEKPWATELCRQVGIGDQLIGSNDADRRTCILVNGNLVPLPDGLMFMVPTNLTAAAISPLFSARTKMRIAREWFDSPRHVEADESVAAFIERHYGVEMVERLADPLLSGVYGGEASNLSVRAVLPRFAEMEAKYGSLGRGMMAARKAVNPTGQRSIFTTLQNGMQTMADAIITRLSPEALHVHTPVQAIQPQGHSWVVSAGFGSDQFDAVIVATPATAAARIINMASLELSGELAAIPYSSSITVALVYGDEVRAALPAGFGFLVPRTVGFNLLATTFVHNKFPHRAPADRALLRCFLGGTRGETMLDLTDQQILGVVRDEIRQILGISAEPRATRIYRWKKAMAQYNVGHLDRIRRIEELVQKLPGLTLAGNAYRGIGVSDCVRSGQDAATQVLAALGVTGVIPK